MMLVVSRLSLDSAVGVSSPIALPCLVEVLDNFCGLQIVGHLACSFWSDFGWCRGMIHSCNSSEEMSCLIVHDDGEQEEVDLPDDTMKVFTNPHEDHN
jgi:hypothetical protein